MPAVVLTFGASDPDSDFEHITQDQDQALPLYHHHMEDTARHRRTKGSAEHGDGDGDIELDEKLRLQYDDQGKDVYSKLRAPVRTGLGGGRVRQPPPPPPTSIVRPFPLPFTT